MPLPGSHGGPPKGACPHAARQLLWYFDKDMLSAHGHSLLQGHGPREDDVVLEVYVLVQRIPELA